MASSLYRSIFFLLVCISLYLCINIETTELFFKDLKISSGTMISTSEMKCTSPLKIGSMSRNRANSTAFYFYLPSLQSCDSAYPFDQHNKDIVRVVVRPSSFSQDIDGALNRLTPLYSGQKIYVDGLTCHASSHKGGSSRMCIGVRGKDEQFLIFADMPPYEDWIEFPLIQTSYFSRELGGVEVIWFAHAKHLADWKIIDLHIWQLLYSWDTNGST